MNHVEKQDQPTDKPASIRKPSYWYSGSVEIGNLKNEIRVCHSMLDILNIAKADKLTERLGFLLQLHAYEVKDNLKYPLYEVDGANPECLAEGNIKYNLMVDDKDFTEKCVMVANSDYWKDK